MICLKEPTSNTLLVTPEALSFLKTFLVVFHPVDAGEGIVICDGKHWVHGGTQIHIKMLQCQNKSKAFLLNSAVE